MLKFAGAVALTLLLATVVSARWQFAEITAVDAAKGTIEYKITFGKNRGDDFKGKLAKDCTIKEGYYRLGKPSRTVEGKDIAGGLKAPVFQKANAANGVLVNIYVADDDDLAAGVKKGEVIKVLVSPPRPKKKR